MTPTLPPAVKKVLDKYPQEISHKFCRNCNIYMPVKLKFCSVCKSELISLRLIPLEALTALEADLNAAHEKEKAEINIAEIQNLEKLMEKLKGYNCGHHGELEKQMLNRIKFLRHNFKQPEAKT